MARHTLHRIEDVWITDAVMISETSNHALSWDGVFLEESRAMFVSWLQSTITLALLEQLGVFYVVPGFDGG